MLKLLVIIECDNCGEAFEHIATSCDRDPKAWRKLASELVSKAEERCWSMYGDTYACADCIHESDID
jgi:hypothetical protein